MLLSLALLALGLGENLLHRRNLNRIPVRVLVNGTRGKSSVTRLIAGALREAGRRTIAKTTGSEARVILENGDEIPVQRRLGPRITEQKALASLAVKRRADALVVECMAVRPESQMVMQRQLVRATIGVITNVRVDHIEEMGGTLDDTLAALSLSIPEEGTLVTADPRFVGTARRVAVVDPSLIAPETIARFSYPVFAENVSLALQVAAEIGIDGETALRGMVNAAPDIGVLRLFKLETSRFKAIVVAGFAANDLTSTEMVWAEASPRVPVNLPLVLLYNNRKDREYRVKEFLRLPRSLPGLRMVAVSGEHSGKVARLFSGQGFETATFDVGTTSEDMLASLGAKLGGAFLLFGVGNIQGAGRNLVTYCIENGSPYDRRKEGECFRNP